MSVTKILVLGKTGEGKSTLCNYILKYNVKKCKESSAPGSCTKTVDGFISNHYKDIFMIDTPGLSDSSGQDQIIVDRIRKAIKDKHGQGIRAIILVSNINTDRLSFDDKRLLLIYCKMFPIPEFWYHVGIVFSKSYEYFPEEFLNELKSTKQKEFLKDLRETIENQTKDLNKTLPPDRQIEIPGVIQAFFTDCGELKPGFNHDRTDKEIERLINWARGNDYLDFSRADFNTDMDINYKSKVQVDDRIDKKDEKVDEKEKKIIVNYYKTYKVIDFYDNENEISEKEPYKTEITFEKEVEWDEDNKPTTETKDGKTTETIEKITWIRVDIFDKDHNLIKKGERREKNKSTKTFNKVIPNQYTKVHVNYDTKIIYTGSISEIQQYFEDVKKSPIPAKIIWTIGNLHPFFLAFNLVGFIVSKIQKKPERWKIVERYYRDEIYEQVTHYKEDGSIDYKEPDRLIDTKNLSKEPDPPVRID